MDQKNDDFVNVGVSTTQKHIQVKFIFLKRQGKRKRDIDRQRELEIVREKKERKIRKKNLKRNKCLVTKLLYN